MVIEVNYTDRQYSASKVAKNQLGSDNLSALQCVWIQTSMYNFQDTQNCLKQKTFWQNLFARVRPEKLVLCT